MKFTLGFMSALLLLILISGIVKLECAATHEVDMCSVVVVPVYLEKPHE